MKHPVHIPKWCKTLTLLMQQWPTQIVTINSFRAIDFQSCHLIDKSASLRAFKPSVVSSKVINVNVTKQFSVTVFNDLPFNVYNCNMIIVDT